ncbi:Hypothetical protein D9617_45g091410 [Elsinoe fawcettii]|nr:Hypothetical protein D9617_45g091410 [Elsinoe fawcettii]
MARCGDSVEYLHAGAWYVEINHTFRTLGVNKKYRESMNQGSPAGGQPAERGPESTPSIPAPNARLVFTLQ